MSKAKWLFMFLLALCMAVPTFAVELSLGGFPSYMRTRARYIGNATFISALSNQNAIDLGFSNNEDNIFFADTTLRLTPQLVLSDAVTIRAQLNVFDNNIWGGSTTAVIGRTQHCCQFQPIFQRQVQGRDPDRSQSDRRPRVF